MGGGYFHSSFFIFIFVVDLGHLGAECNNVLLFLLECFRMIRTKNEINYRIHN